MNRIPFFIGLVTSMVCLENFPSSESHWLNKEHFLLQARLQECVKDRVNDLQVVGHKSLPIRQADSEFGYFERIEELEGGVRDLAVIRDLATLVLETGVSFLDKIIPCGGGTYRIPSIPKLDKTKKTYTRKKAFNDFAHCMLGFTDFVKGNSWEADAKNNPDLTTVTDPSNPNCTIIVNYRGKFLHGEEELLPDDTRRWLLQKKLEVLQEPECNVEFPTINNYEVVSPYDNIVMQQAECEKILRVYKENPRIPVPSDWTLFAHALLKCGRDEVPSDRLLFAIWMRARNENMQSKLAIKSNESPTAQDTQQAPSEENAIVLE